MYSFWLNISCGFGLKKQDNVSLMVLQGDNNEDYQVEICMLIIHWINSFDCAEITGKMVGYKITKLKVH